MLTDFYMEHELPWLRQRTRGPTALSYNRFKFFWTEFVNAGLPSRRRNLISQSSHGCVAAEAHVVSFVVSFSQQPALEAIPRYDTNAQNTALMLLFVVSDLL